MKIGIIGIGSMGAIIANALYKKKYDLILSNRGKNLKEFEEKNLEIKSNLEVSRQADYIFLAVKPHIYPIIAQEIKACIDNQVIISIAAGQSIKTLEEQFGSDKKIIMAMPNTPAKIGEGMSAICSNKNVGEDELGKVLEMFRSFGKAEIIEEDQFDGFGAAVGCLPAYVYMFIEAIADAAVLTGLKRDQAYEFVAQTVKGSAQMLLETKNHPGVLKDQVTSPKGTTIEGLKVLEERAFRGSVIDAINAAYEKSRKM